MEGYTHYMYESEKYINLADKYISMYKDMSTTEMFFEDADVVTSNQDAGNKSVGFIKRAITAIKEMISKIVDKVTTFFQTMFMSKDEKNKFKKFKESIKNNPEFAGKKITVADFREINKRYQSALNEIDNGIVQMQREESERAAEIADNICKKVQNIVKGTKDSAVAVFSVDTALRLAEGSREVAKWINSKLTEESNVMKQLEAQLGDERAKDFKKRIKSSTKFLSLHRMKVMVLGQYHGTMSGSLNQVITDFEQLLSPKTDIKTNAKRLTQTRIVDDALGSFNTKTDNNIRKRDIIKTGIDIKREVDSSKKAFQKSSKNKQKEIERMRREAEKSNKKSEKEKSKSHDSLLRFIGS